MPSITDNSVTIRLVLWENDITKVTTDSSYKLRKVMVRVYDEEKYLTLNKQAIINQITEELIRE